MNIVNRHNNSSHKGNWPQNAGDFSQPGDGRNAVCPTLQGKAGTSSLKLHIQWEFKPFDISTRRKQNEQKLVETINDPSIDIVAIRLENNLLDRVFCKYFAFFIFSSLSDNTLRISETITNNITRRNIPDISKPQLI